eukprot:9276011-Pyramimonas_sp.AAC.1
MRQSRSDIVPVLSRSGSSSRVWGAWGHIQHAFELAREEDDGEHIPYRNAHCHVESEQQVGAWASRAFPRPGNELLLLRLDAQRSS